MGKPKVILVLLAFFGVYFVAAGGFHALHESDRTFLEVVGYPLIRGSGLDTVLGMLCLILLCWGLLPALVGNKISRTALLQGVALGSALITATCVVVVLNYHTSEHPQFPGVFGIVALLQGAVGVTAALLLLCHSESRRLAVIPLVLNGALTLFVIAAICVPLFL
ncbi:MAG: hypothetical protein V3T77_09245 [Planctomycetota bacterium]